MKKTSEQFLEIAYKALSENGFKEIKPLAKNRISCRKGNNVVEVIIHRRNIPETESPSSLLNKKIVSYGHGFEREVLYLFIAWVEVDNGIHFCLFNSSEYEMIARQAKEKRLHIPELKKKIQAMKEAGKFGVYKFIPD